ncbi:Tn7-like element transposition protein TnsE [uncultured Tissierella sp.]|uniref:Tn7-like element transposition protein TnsE n=1 Tax=uncultured Tissierella sp. TaxID=448160 RepID=UPI002805061D|nr:Tn7-like element transposition protein TnsE [uncultured Tissierella sp.]MDU5080991.1 Tn7-like element transposition protein TnsE [Bacillota bacterium]
MDNKWVIDVYFKSDKFLEKITLDWASIHFLAFGRYYFNGNLNNSQIHKKAVIKDLNLNNVKFVMTQDSLNVEYKEIKTDIFVGYKNGIEYRIPALEIIRAVIATNRFLLNRIVELDSLSKYFVYRFDDKNNLYIDFFDEYERKLLSAEYVRHLAWIITNENILRMFSQLGQNLWLEGNIKYDFLFKEFDIKARIHEDKKVVRILEIIEFKNKKINAKEIFISSKYINELNVSSEPKLRKYRSLNKTDDKILDSKIDGANNNESDFINTLDTKHIYSSDVKINRRKRNRKTLRTKEDNSTKIYEIENDNLRTTADTGGLDKTKGLEYENIEDINVKGELEEFIEIMKLLKNKKDIEDVQVIINDLPEGKRGKKFSKLQDGETNRQYVVGKIIMKNGKEFSLIEVEREEKSLSMLLLYAIKPIDWTSIYFKLTLGLVNKSGTWDSSSLKRLEMKGLYSKRIRHKSDKSSIYDKCNYIYEKILENKSI